MACECHSGDFSFIEREERVPDGKTRDSFAQMVTSEIDARLLLEARAWFCYCTVLGFMPIAGRFCL